MKYPDEMYKYRITIKRLTNDLFDLFNDAYETPGIPRQVKVLTETGEYEIILTRRMNVSRGTEWDR